MSEDLMKLLRTVRQAQLSWHHYVTIAVLSTVLVNEWLVYFIQSARWPHIPADRSSGLDKEQVVLLVADPQIQGYQEESIFPLGQLARWDIDRYLRTSFSYAVSYAKPDIVIFLGDLMDEGSKAHGQEYMVTLERFHSVFGAAKHIKKIYIPGDNDIGGELPDIRTVEKEKRFERHFENITGLVKFGFIDYVKTDVKTASVSSSKLEVIGGLAKKLTSPVRVIINHESMLGLHSAKHFSFPSRIYKCEDCMMDNDFSWSVEKHDMTQMDDYVTVDLRGQYSLSEIAVPTCSYRMGEKNMGYGVAIMAFIFVNGSDFTFKYYEQDEEADQAGIPQTPTVTKYVTLTGSYGNLGDWPHWCLGHMGHCPNGLALDIWIKFTEIGEDSPPLIVFSNGGHSRYSNGIFLVQSYGSEYEVGVSMGEQVWSVEFRLVPKLWVNIYAVWGPSSGLFVLVDGVSYGDLDPDTRDFEPWMFETFMDVVIGVDLDGSPHVEESRFEIQKLSFFNWEAPIVVDNEQEIHWLGCGPFTISDTTPISNEAMAVSECRSSCTTEDTPVAAIQDNSLCACVNMSFVDNTFSAQSMCGDSYWHLYAGSAAASNDADYSISVTVEKLGNKEYVKPLEAVVIQIETNFDVDVPFYVDLGDGTVLDIAGNELSYFWSKEGLFEIRVLTFVGIATVTGSTTFLVEDIDEGYAGDFIMIDTFHDELSQIGHVDVTSIDYATSDCYLRIGGVGVENFTDLSDYVEFRSISQNFSNFGQYYTKVECINPYGTIRNDTDFTSRKFETSFHFQEVGTDFQTEIVGNAEFYYDLMVDHSDKNITVVHQVSDKIVTIEPQFLRIQENYLTYKLDDLTIDKRILYVQNKINQPEIISRQFDGAWNLTTNITVKVPAGNNMYLNVSFSSGEDQVFYIHYLPSTSEIVFEIFFPSLGYYPVTANISNDISFNSTEALVSVEVPIRTITVYTEDITDKSKPLVLQIQLNDGMQGPAKANFRVDYDNGVVETYHYYSTTYFFTTYEHEYYYPDWGTYAICVTAFNQISSVRDCITVQVGQKITYVDITMPSAGRFEINETTTSIVRCPKGSDKTYVVDFGDGETFVFTDRYLKDTEHFEETTTSSTTFMTSVGSDFSDTNFSDNSTDMFVNGTQDFLTTTISFAMNATTSMFETGQNDTNTNLERKKRETNGTQDDSAFAAAGAQSAEASDSESATQQATGLPSTGSGTDMYSSSSNLSAATTESSLMNSTSEADQTSGNYGTANETMEASTTNAPQITTIMVTTTTADPIPDNATNPFSTNVSTAKRLRDGTIKVTHRYQFEGTFTIKVKAMNHFNWAKDTLCPPVKVRQPDTTPGCDSPAIELPSKSKLVSSLRSPLQFFRSDQINLTASVKLRGCEGSSVTYSWRTLKIVDEEGRQIQRPHHGDGLCLLENSEKIFRYPRSSVPFGLYRVILTVSPSEHPLKASMINFYMRVKPSAPYAIIDGNEEHQWFLVYATTILKFHRSVDPDFDTTDGIEYDLFCMKETDKRVAEQETKESLISQSSLIVEGITHRYTSKNKVRLYEYSNCFEKSSNLTADVRFPKGEFNIPSEYFVSDVISFAMGLYVTKNNLTTSAYATFEIRLSNSSNLLDQLDDLLKSKDTTGVMRAVEALSGLLVTDSANGTEEEDFEAKEEMTELKSKLIGALDSVSSGVKDIEQCGGMLSLVDGLTKDASSTSDGARVSATSAIKNSAGVAEEFGDESLDTLEGVGQKVVGGVSNVLPTKDTSMDELKKQHEQAKKLAEQEAAAKLAPTEGAAETDNTESASGKDTQDIILEEEEEIDPALAGELTEEELNAKTPLPYNKLLKKFDLLHNAPIERMYTYLVFYESIFRHVIKNKSEEIMISADILKMNRNDIFGYIAVLEEPGDVEWYFNRFFDQEKHRRDMIRKNADRDVSKSFLGAIDSVSSVMLNKTEGNQTVELNAKGLNVAMKKTAANGTEEDTDEDVMESEGGGVQLPKDLLGEAGNGSEIGQTMIVNENSPFTFGNENDTTEVGTSVLTLKFSTPGTKDEVKVSNASKPMTIKVKGDTTKIAPPKMYALIVKDGEADNTINYHVINVTKNETSVHVILTPLDPENTFDVLLQYEDYPNDTNHLDLDTVPHPEEEGNYTHKEMLRHTYFPNPSLTAQAGIYRVGVKIRNARRDFSRDVEVYNYTWQMFLGGCRFWNEENETWSSEGCVVGNRTTYYETHCLCTHLTSFGGEMVVPPNTIDFNNVWAKFKSLNENAAVFSTVVALLGLYVIGLIWARHMDKKDIVKWGASPLEDNLPTDNYHYQLSVTTGMKKNAGTASNISFIIAGENCDTGVRRMFDGKRKRHERGSIMNYILSVENKLGPLTFCRVFHDNSGKGKTRSWFLDQIECTDLQTGERYFFLCNRWLACEEDDGMVDRILPVAGLEDLVAFKQLFSSSVRKKLTSDHLWLSVFSRPTRSSFTRVQRISCCMSLLFLTMITNAMWFKSDSDGESQQQVVALKLGPFSFTLQQVFISLMSTIIVFPPSFLLVTLFRRTKQKKNTIIQSNLRRPKRGKWKNLGNNQSHSDLWGSRPKSSKLRKFKESISELLKGNKKSKYDACDDEEESSIPAARLAGDRSAKKEPQKKKKPFMFPAWCSYIAWILCFFSIIAPAFFTILYSMEWGATKANEWLTTFLLSFFQSVIVVQPIKVLCLVAFIACVLKKPDLEEEGDCSDELNNAIAAQDEVLMTKGQDAVSEIAEKRRQANAEFEPPDMEALEKSRENRMKEIRMEEILKEIFVYGFFVLVLFFLSYQQRDKESFVYTENLKSMFLGKFESISTVLDYWVWLEKYFLPTLYMAKYHNGTEMVRWWDKRCINDFMSRRVGIARLRQMRIKNDSCTILDEFETVIDHCRNDYNWFDDDTRAYLPGWIKTSEENETILDDLEDIDPWVYQNSFRLKNAPYMATLQSYKGGGYVVNFERSFRRTARNLTRLRQENWLDLRTRAIFLEFTVYNPNSNLYGSAIMVTEFPSWGSAVARSEFKVFRLQSYVGGFAIVIIFFEVLYCIFTLYFFVRCIRKVKKERCAYFKSFWDILEFVLLCFAVSCIAMYAFKHILTEVAMHSLKKQSKAEFINFQSLALYDEFYGYMTAFVVFLASIQFLKLLQFNKKMNMLGDTVRVATKDLKVFSIAFLLYFFAFVVAGYLLFGQHLASYNGIIQSMESAFAFALGSFDFEAMSGAQKFLGPIFFFLYIGVVYVGLMSIFLTIIADAFTTVKEDTETRSNDYEMVDFIWRRFKGIIGVK